VKSIHYLVVGALTLILSSCNLALKVKDGDMAYQLKHYGLAAKLYIAEYEASNDPKVKAYKASMASKSYTQVNDLDNAYQWIVNRMSIDKSIDDLPQLGTLALSQNELELATKVYQQLYKATNNLNYSRQLSYIEGLNYDQERFKVTSQSFNTESSEYSPLKYEGRYILFSSDRPSDEISANTFTGRNTSNLYLVSESNASVFPFDNPINTTAAEGTATFNKTFNEMYFTRCVAIDERDSYCRVYQSRRIQGQWLEPEPILFFDESINVGNPAYMDIDSTLFFSARVDDNHQIYYSRKVEEGWTLPEMMQESISGPFDEKFPVVEEDTLYFSSNRIPGYGSLDIYKTYIDDRGYWKQPELLESPYNSGADDFGYTTLEQYPANSDKVKSVLVASNRKGTKGLDDIFAIDEYRVTPDIPVTTDPKKTYKIYLAVKVVDSNDRSKLEGTVTLINSKGDKDQNSLKKGSYITELESSENLSILAESYGYFNKTNQINIPNQANLVADTTLNVTVNLDPIEIGKEIILENIYYDYDKSDIRQDAKPSLNALIDLLKTNPSISIELASHTDCRGDFDYNRDLSKRRAESARLYLVESGISGIRIISKGYGESLPLNTCSCDDCDDDQHQENRRTSFKVTGI